MSFPNIIFGDYGDEKAQSSAKMLPLGTRMELPDGRRFAYSRVSSAGVTAGRVVQQAAVIDSATDQDMVNTAGGGAGSTTITLTAAATVITADQFADGFIFFNDLTGEGYTYKIKSNLSAASVSACVFTLADGDTFITAADTTTQVGIRRNTYDTVAERTAGTTVTGATLGIAPRTVTASYYFWLQRRGEVAAFAQGTVVAGDYVIASTVTDGCVAPKTAMSAGTGAIGDTDVVIGTCLNAPAASTEYGLIYLSLE